MQGRSNSFTFGAFALFIVGSYLFGAMTLGLFAVPIGPSSTPIPTATPTATPTAVPTPPTPPVSIPPTVLSGCECAADDQPIYDSFPNPEHTNESFAVFNFYNDNARDENNNDMTVWVSMFITADGRMEDADSRFRAGFTYVYVDAVPLARGELFTYTMDKALTSRGRLGGAGRAPGGRIVIYYEDPATHDVLRNTRYNGSYPTQTADNIVPILGENDAPAIPSVLYSQLLEFTMDVDPGANPDTQAFIDYDLSAVDTIAMPVYIFGGYDPRTLPGATSGNVNNGFPCGKAYIGCQTTHETTEGCPTQIVERTTHGSVCQSTLKYCSLVHNFELATSDVIQNKTNWNVTCHKFDSIAAGFGITQAQLDLYYNCAFTQNTTPPCPPILAPDVTTPSTVIYGCMGQFLLENHCLLDGSRYTRSRLDGPQCSALNRGLCIEPNYYPVPEPDGLSCARFACPQNPGVSCMIPCTNYTSCFGATCLNYSQLAPFEANCSGVSCIVGGMVPNCIEHDRPISKSKQALCNDSSPLPYERGLIQNDYAAWARTKGERYYAFSLDEEVGGGNQQCLFSTQLDVVIFPRCNGNYVPPAQ